MTESEERSEIERPLQVCKYTKVVNADRLGLTGRELETLEYVVNGYKNRRIAKAMVITVKTVEKHRQEVVNNLSNLAQHRLNGPELVIFLQINGMLEHTTTNLTPRPDSQYLDI